jgi:hypothetical protein
MKANEILVTANTTMKNTLTISNPNPSDDKRIISKREIAAEIAQTIGWK